MKWDEATRRPARHQLMIASPGDEVIHATSINRSAVVGWNSYGALSPAPILTIWWEAAGVSDPIRTFKWENLSLFHVEHGHSPSRTSLN